MTNQEAPYTAITLDLLSVQAERRAAQVAAGTIAPEEVAEVTSIAPDAQAFLGQTIVEHDIAS
jgi:hypothetical protein